MTDYKTFNRFAPKVELTEKQRKERLERLRQKLIASRTLAEKGLKEALTNHKISFEFQKPFFDSKFSAIVDFFIQIGDQKIAVELDGEYHNTFDQIEKDKYRTKWLIKSKSVDKVVRFTNQELIDNTEKCINKLGMYATVILGGFKPRNSKGKKRFKRNEYKFGQHNPNKPK